ncbi:MAG: hypothetical protein EOQ93_31965 [Mesorhizobium sp.]|nr:MAG: hypothetical protein EOQ93_31965 [Mesorhizobium sp.]RWM94912.1 MAG: hypothetical protein EOR86_15630 [Mesorhizobium sp.]
MVAIATITAPAGNAWADAEDCQNAIASYNSATSDISYTLKRYANCVGDSQGKDDCDFEFRKLKSAQDDFESAVSDYRSNCD